MTVSKSGLATDLAALDAREVAPEDDDDLPELTEEDFARGTVRLAGVPVKRGRPAPNGAKVQVTLRLDPGVLARFKEDGPGWQSRINAALGQWLASQRSERG